MLTAQLLCRSYVQIMCLTLLNCELAWDQTSRQMGLDLWLRSGLFNVSYLLLYIIAGLTSNLKLILGFAGTGRGQAKGVLVISVSE
mmetsp:Transcript_18995/g.26488  ORF Transcript_18995/g.26488 Transcript_18995/m.26488 type:complete len:86 (-) Transcript_18995:2769-3026(-)